MYNIFMSNATNTHQYEEANLGEAPFEYLGFEEKAGTCGLCGRALQVIFSVKSSCGQISHVGSSCVTKHGDHGMISHVKTATAARRRAAAATKHDANVAEVLALIHLRGAAMRVAPKGLVAALRGDFDTFSNPRSRHRKAMVTRLLKALKAVA